MKKENEGKRPYQNHTMTVYCRAFGQIEKLAKVAFFKENRIFFANVHITPRTSSFRNLSEHPKNQQEPKLRYKFGISENL